MSECAFVPDWPDLPGHIGVLSTLRTGGVSHFPYSDLAGSNGLNLGSHVGDQPEHVMQNRAILGQLLPVDPVWLVQVHGTKVLDLGEPQCDLTADACFTAKSSIICAVQTADCLPVLLCDPKNNVVAAAHAGWRSLVHGVLENTLAAMQQGGAALENISVWLGPAIGPSQFEIGAEVREKFMQADLCAAAAFQISPIRAEKYYADIDHLARLRLQRAGVMQIHGGGFCTVSSADKFYSYRRDGVTGRMASLIWIKEVR